MKRIQESPRRARGIALVATLALLVFLGCMIAEVIRGNVAQRRYLNLRRAQTTALYLAESGVSEALNAIPRHRGETSLDRVAGGRKFHVEWVEEKPGTDVYEIRSVGINDGDDLASARRSIKVRARARADQPAKILAWETASAGP